MLNTLKNLVTSGIVLFSRIVGGIVGLASLAFLSILGMLLLYMILAPAGGCFMLFLNTYQVENLSGRSLEITPVYNYRQDDSYHLCYRLREPGTGSFREVPIQTKIPIASGAVVSISWDSDSGVPVFLLMKDPAREEIKVLYLHGPGVAASTSGYGRFHIPPFDQMPRAPEKMLPGFEGKSFTWLPPKQLAALIASGS